jgi:hypothetical protein
VEVGAPARGDFDRASRHVIGPILVRASDLVDHQRLVFVGPYAAGPAVGTDMLDGQVVLQQLEVVINDVVPPYAWQFEVGNPNGGVCPGSQVDGPGFTETFSW